jgi:hypothetical protein
MCVFLVTFVDYSLLHDGKTNEFIEFVPISIIALKLVNMFEKVVRKVILMSSK